MSTFFSSNHAHVLNIDRDFDFPKILLIFYSQKFLKVWSTDANPIFFINSYVKKIRWRKNVFHILHEVGTKNKFYNTKDFSYEFNLTFFLNQSL